MIRLRWTSSKSNWTAAAALAATRSGAFDRTEDFPLVAKQDDAPAALHPAGELGGAVFLAGAAGRHQEILISSFRITISENLALDRGLEKEWTCRDAC
jgi:hypothetical protein